MAEHRRLSEQLARRERAPTRKAVSKLQAELEQSKTAHQAELEALKARLDQELGEANAIRRRAEQDASDKANQLEAALAEKAEIAGAAAIAKLAIKATKEKIARLRIRCTCSRSTRRVR